MNNVGCISDICFLQNWKGKEKEDASVTGFFVSPPQNIYIARRDPEWVKKVSLFLFWGFQN